MLREWRHSAFELDALMVVKVDVSVDHVSGMDEGVQFAVINDKV